METCKIKVKYLFEEIFKGKNPKYVDEINNNIIFGQRNNTKNGKMSFENCKYTNDLFWKSRDEKEFLRYGDILINSLGGGTCGRIGYFDIVGEKILSDGIPYILRTENNSKYLYYCLKINQDVFEKISIGATNQVSLLLFDLANFKLEIINDAKKQTKIVEFLNEEISEIDNVINKTKETIEDYKKYKQSIITKVVTKGLNENAYFKNSNIEWIGKIPANWSVCKFKHLGNARNGLTYSPEDVCEKNDGMLVLRSSNIKDGKLCFEDNVYVNKKIKDELKVNIGDIVLCSRNGSRALIGKNAIIDKDIDATFGAFMMIFRCKSNPRYMKYILDSDVFKYYLGTFLTSTINQLTYDNFANMKIVYTEDEKEQNEIIKYLDVKCNEIDRLIESKEKIIEELEQYKKSVIYEYVMGKKEVK